MDRPAHKFRCGDTPPPLENLDPTDALCNFACPGDSNDRCGATGYVSVFYDPTKYVKGTDPALYGPQTPLQVGDYNYQGCYSEATNGRALNDLSPPEPSGGFTLESCMSACQGYKYFGMEYANQVRNSASPWRLLLTVVSAIVEILLVQAR